MTTASEYLADFIRAQEIPFVAGIPGHGNLTFFDSLRGAGIQTVMVRHEQSAAFLADGYSRVTGRPAVISASVGPGSINCLVGLATAMADASPIIAITGDVQTYMRDRGAIQDIGFHRTADFASMVSPVVKRSWSVTAADQLPDIIHRAHMLAVSGRPGPVHLQIPMDVQAAVLTPGFRDSRVPSWPGSSHPAPDLIEAAAMALVQAKNPVVLAGGGVSIGRAEQELVALCEYLGVPVVTTLTAKGVIPEDHPLNAYYTGPKGSTATSASTAHRPCNPGDDQRHPGIDGETHIARWSSCERRFPKRSVAMVGPSYRRRQRGSSSSPSRCRFVRKTFERSENVAELFEPIAINSMELPHRLITGPMERGLANRDGTMTTRYVEYLSARAAGGAGLIQVESTFVDPRGRGHLFQVGCHVDEVVEPLTRAASAVHAHGAKIALELYLGGRETPSVMSQRQPIAPSQVKCEVLSPVPTPRSMTHSDMEDVVGSFVLATQRAVQAGIDMIHLHGAHGYLIGSFLSPFSNRREDEFGGSLVNRARFPLMIIRAVRDALGPTAPLGYRLSADEFIPNGLRLEESRQFATMLADAGIDLIDVSGGIYESAHTIIQGAGSAATPFVSLAKAIKDEVGEDAVVSVAQRLSEPGVAEQVLAQGIDMVSLTRAFHADPEYVNKVRGGRPDQVIPCVACHHCTDMLEANLPVDCSVNPRSTREYLAEPTMGPRKLRVAVIGGGPAGLRAAIGLAEMGHRVVLIHREDQFGGQLLRASMVGDFHRYVDYATSRIDVLGIEVRLRTEADAALIDQLAPDAVIVATGAKGAPPAYDIRDRVEPSDLFSAPLSNPRAWNGKALIVGGDGTDCAAAIQLAHSRLKVIVVEPDDALAKDRRTPGRAHLLRLLEAEPNIEVHLETTVEAVGNGYAEIQSRGIASRLRGISHVVSGGRQSENELAEQLAASGHPKVLTIGDAARPRDLHSATLEGMKAAALISAEAAAIALS